MTKFLLALVFVFASSSFGISGTFLRSPRDLRLTNIRILAERVVGDRTEFEFTADVQNSGAGVYRDVSVSLRHDMAMNFTTVDGTLQFSSLGSNATALGDAANTYTASVASGQLTGAEASRILSGEILELSAVEEFVYAGPTKYIDAASDVGFTGTSEALGMRILVFSNNVPLLQNLVRGDIILADPASGGYKPRGPSGFMTAPLSIQIPFEVESVVVVGERTHVYGHQRTISQILKSGTFVGDTSNAYQSSLDPYDPVVENTYTEEEQAARELQAAAIRENDPHDGRLADLAGLKAIPFRFNQVRIGDAIDLSGEVLLRSSGLKFEITFRDFQMTRAAAHIDAGLVATLLLETVGTNDNATAPIFEKEVELLRVPLPPVPMNIAGVPVSLAGNFSVVVGAEATAPSGLSVPIQTAVVVGAEIGWDGQQAFTAPVRDFIEPHISDPTVFDAVQATARAWAEARFEVTLGDSLQVVSAGPSLAIRAEGKFTANPFANPWWNLDFTGELVGAFNLNFLGFNIVGAEKSFWKEPFFHDDAKGPLIAAAPAGKAKGNNSEAGQPLPFTATDDLFQLMPKAGQNSRWGLAFQPKPGQAAYGPGFVLPLQGGDLFVAGSSALATFLARVTPDGRIVWCQNFQTIIQTVAGAQLNDGRIAMVGRHGLNWIFTIYDANGNRQAAHSYYLANSTEVTDMAVTYDTAGQPVFTLVGFWNRTTVRDSDPILLRLDANGNILDSVVYENPGDDEFNSIDVLADGRFVLTGFTDTDVVSGLHPPQSGFVAMLNNKHPELEVQQAIAVHSRWGMEFTDAVQAPDGSIFAVGANNDIVVNYYPSILVAKFSAEGELLQHVLLGEDPDSEDMLPNAGDTPYDFAAQIVWTEEGPYIVGTSGLGAQTAGFVAALTDELGVRWFSSFDGSRADSFQDVAVTEDGLAVMGWSDSVMPFGTGGEHAVTLFKYPWEGILRIHPDVNAETAYLQPRTFLSSENIDFIAIDNSNPQQPVSMRTKPVLGTYQKIIWEVRNTTVPTGTAVMAEWARLERIDPSAVDNFADWTAYHQLAAGEAGLMGDWDGDGQVNVEEFTFGTNPYEADAAPAAIVDLDLEGERDVLSLRFEVASWANLPFALLAGSDIGAPLAPVTNFTVKEEGPSSTPGKRVVSLQEATQMENRRFYRIGVKLE